MLFVSHGVSTESTHYNTEPLLQWRRQGNVQASTVFQPSTVHVYKNCQSGTTTIMLTDEPRKRLIAKIYRAVRSYSGDGTRNKQSNARNVSVCCQIGEVS